jgi:hypothetical protein
MAKARLVAGFWAAVEDCLVQIHQIPRPEAALKITGLLRRLANISSTISEKAGPTFDDMIYHEEPWYIACNLANSEKPLEQHRAAYEQILKANQLA